MQGIEDFIVAAKRATYVGDGTAADPCRAGSHDLRYLAGDWAYLDSYFGGTDFLGQETVWRSGRPCWAMNYYGHILRRDLIDAETAGRIIKTALRLMYAEGRFLGGFTHRIQGYSYEDRTTGTCERFHGTEQISTDGIVVYELQYHGGLIVD